MILKGMFFNKRTHAYMTVMTVDVDLVIRRQCDRYCGLLYPQGAEVNIC